MRKEKRSNPIGDEGLRGGWKGEVGSWGDEAKVSKIFPALLPHPQTWRQKQLEGHVICSRGIGRRYRAGGCTRVGWDSKLPVSSSRM
jgi:hypothetical protein